MSRVSSGEHTAIGAVAGMSEVCIMQPVVGIKNALQEGRALPRQVSHLYRGLGVNVLSMAPSTATQFGANSVCQKLCPLLGVGGESKEGKLLCAATAGGISGAVISPAEVLIIQQQKSGKSLVAQASSFLEKYGVRTLLTRGLGMAMARESIYVGGYLGLYPVLQEYMEDHPQFRKWPTGTATLTSGVIAGFLGAFFSHPFDTVKTRQQAFMYSRPEYVGAWSGMRSVCREHGVKALWNGFGPRVFRIVCAVFILNGIKDVTVDYLERKRSTDTQTLQLEPSPIESVSFE